LSSREQHTTLTEVLADGLRLLLKQSAANTQKPMPLDLLDCTDPLRATPTCFTNAKSRIISCGHAAVFGIDGSPVERDHAIAGSGPATGLAWAEV
jgi:hypothetical protein